MVRFKKGRRARELSGLVDQRYEYDETGPILGWYT